MHLCVRRRRASDRGYRTVRDDSPQLEKASTYDDTFSALSGKVETLSYEIEDIHDALLRYADSFDFDEHALDAMQSRMAAIEKLKRKYGVTVADILQFLAKQGRL